MPRNFDITVRTVDGGIETHVTLLDVDPKIFPKGNGKIGASDQATKENVEDWELNDDENMTDWLAGVVERLIEDTLNTEYEDTSYFKEHGVPRISS